MNYCTHKIVICDFYGCLLHLLHSLSVLWVSYILIFFLVVVFLSVGTLVDPVVSHKKLLGSYPS